MAKANIANVELVEMDNYKVVYESGAERYFTADKLPGTVKKWLESHETTEPEREPEQKPLDTMCENCAKYGVTCEGSFTGVYTGCVFKKVKEDQEINKATTAEEPETITEMNEAEEPETAFDEEAEDEFWNNFDFDAIPEGVNQTPWEGVVLEDLPEPEPEEIETEAETRQLPATEPEEETKPEPVRKEGPGAAEAVGFGLMIAAAIIWEVSRGLAGLLIEAIKTAAYIIWTHREEIAENVRGAADQIGTASRKAYAATIETGKAVLAGFAIILYMVDIYRA